MGVRLAAAGVAVAGAAALVTSQGYGPVASSHLFAPSVPLTCQAPDHRVTAWWRPSAPQVQPGYGGAPTDVFPGEVNSRHWLGWIEVAGCSVPFTAHAGAR